MPQLRLSKSSSDPEHYDPRVVLAAERTLLAWIRTGLALMGFGFVVDHSRTKLVGLWRSGLWEIVPGDDAEQAIVNCAYGEAQQIIETAGAETSLDQRARAQADEVLGRFFEAMGWKVTIRWSDRQ